MNGKIFAIGDIHGEFPKLKELIKKLHITKNDTLIFLGDYIDRGIFSFNVISYLIHLTNRYNCVFLMGNHEKMFMNYLFGRDEQLYLYNGGLQTVDSYRDNDYNINLDIECNSRLIPLEHFNFFRGLKKYHETEDYIFVHAGIQAGVPMEQQPEKTLLWDRDFCYFYSEKYKGPKIVVYGHTASSCVKNDKFAICIDTGAGYAGQGLGSITCVELPGRKIYKQGVFNKDVYDYYYSKKKNNTDT